MAFTRPKASQINFDVTNISDPLIRLNSAETGNADKDAGFVIERGDDTNVAIIYDESADQFALVNTTETGSTSGNVTIASYAGLQAGNINNTGTLTVSGAVNFNDTTGSTSTTTGALIVDGGVAIAENLFVGGTIDMDRLSLTSSQTTVPPLRLTANSLNDGVGALRIDGSQADIYLNPSTATHTTVTFAVNEDQRLAFGMDNSSDFYITRRTGGAWYDDTFVIDRDTGELRYGYDLTVAGDTTVTGNLTVNGTTTTISTTNSRISDSLIELNNGATSNTNDLGFIFERGSTGNNAAIIWDESADVFVLGTTTATGDSTGDLTVTAGALSIGSLTLGGTLVTASAAELNYVDGVTSNIQTQIDGKLALTGGTMSGAIAMGSNRVTNVGDPSEAQDVVTKAYFEANASSGGGASGGFTSSTFTTTPGADGDFDLAKQQDQTGSVETPFEAAGSDAFGVSLGEVYSMMEPLGSTITLDLGVFT